MTGRSSIFLISTAVLCSISAISPAAAQFAAAGAKANLVVEYEYVSSGKRQDKYDTNEWNVRRYAEVKASVVAQKPMAAPSLHKADPSLAKETEKRGAAAGRAAKTMEPTMQDMMAIVAKCGEDEACLEREVQAYAGANADELNETREKAAPDVAAASKDMKSRYQLWQPVGQDATTYDVKEDQRFVDADPICQGHPNQRCTRTEKRVGSGPLPLPPGVKKGDAAGTAMIEVDATTKDMILVLPTPLMPLSAKQTIATDHPEQQSGASDVYVNFPPRQLIKQISVKLAGSSLAQSGEEKIDVKLASNNPRTLEPTVIENGTLTVRWRVSPQ